jgi:hypothetical protein
LRTEWSNEAIASLVGKVSGADVTDREKTPTEPTAYRLDELAMLAGELGLTSDRVHTDRLDVILFEGCRLASCNLPDAPHTLVGFDGTPWHSHGIVSFMAGSPY